MTLCRRIPSKSRPMAAFGAFAALLAALAFSGARPALSQATAEQGLSGFYISGDLGTGITNDPVGSDGYKTELTPGFLIGGAFGYSFGRYKVEGEIFYQGYDVEDQTRDGVSRAAAIPPPLFGSQPEIEGAYSALATMLNGYVEFGSWERTRLFVGAGAGMARVSSKIEAVSHFIIWESTVETIVDDTDTVFAYQGMAGMTWQVSPRLDLVLKYRYFATEDPTFTDYTGAAVSQDGMRTHAVTFGARFKF